MGYVVAIDGLVVDGDPTKTANDIMGSQRVFRTGIVSLYIAAALDVIVGWVPYRVFAPVNGSNPRLGAWLRIAYAAV